MSVLSVRVNPDERALLDEAAEHAHTNLSDFIRRKALEAAEADILGRTVVTIPARDWEAFEYWLDRPPVRSPRSGSSLRERLAGIVEPVRNTAKTAGGRR